MLSRSFITFLSRSKHLLISWLWSPSAAPKNKVCHFISMHSVYFWKNHIIPIIPLPSESNITHLKNIISIIFQDKKEKTELFMCHMLNHVQIFVTSWTVCSPPGFLCPWDFTSKNIGVGCHFLHQGIFPTQHRTCISYVSCTAGGFFINRGINLVPYS